MSIRKEYVCQRLGCWGTAEPYLHTYPFGKTNGAMNIKNVLSFRCAKCGITLRVSDLKAAMRLGKVSNLDKMPGHEADYEDYLEVINKE